MRLSLILASKNDHYCGNPLDRLQTVLNNTASRLQGYKSEIIVTDWGSDVPISENIQLTKEAKSLVRFNYISKAVTSRIHSPFSEPHALNYAAKLATGEFLGRIDQDTIIGDKFIEWFFKGVNCHLGCFFFSSRRDLEENQALVLEPEKVDRWYSSKKDLEYWRSAVGIFLIPKEAYLKIGGYDEANIYKNHMEHEFFCRLKKILTPVDLGKEINYDFYHLWHIREDNINAKQNQALSTKRLERLPLYANEKATFKDLCLKFYIKATSKRFYKSLLRNMK